MDPAEGPGLETLELRLQRSCDSALKIAKELQGRPKLNHARYPTLDNFPQVALARRQMKSGGTTMVSLDLKGGKEPSFPFLNALKLVLTSNNLGDSKSLATHPATTRHQRLSPEQKARRESRRA